MWLYLPCNGVAWQWCLARRCSTVAAAFSGPFGNERARRHDSSAAAASAACTVCLALGRAHSEARHLVRTGRRAYLRVVVRSVCRIRLRIVGPAGRSSHFWHMVWPSAFLWHRLVGQPVCCPCVELMGRSRARTRSEFMVWPRGLLQHVGTVFPSCR